ncbi:MAG: SRPBCC domain-containing protein [Chloroflexota bacterium]
MSAQSGSEASASSREFRISRTFDAPRPLVFAAFSRPEYLARWWGPRGFEIHVSKLEFSPGGIFHYRMAGPDSFEMWGRFVFREIVPTERIVIVNSFSDPAGNVVRGPFGPTLPLEILLTFTLAEQDAQTALTLHAIPINATAEEHATFEDMFDSMQQGFGNSLDQLAVHLAEAQAPT